MNSRIYQWSLVAVLALFAACEGEVAPGATEFVGPQNTTVTEDDSGLVSLSLGSAKYAYPADVCEITQGYAMVQGRDGESGIAIQVDAIGVQASFQDHFEEDGERFWDTWDSQRDMQYSVAGNTISASGTMKRIGRRVAQGEAMWEYLQGIDVLEESFTLSASCPR